MTTIGCNILGDGDPGSQIQTVSELLLRISDQYEIVEKDEAGIESMSPADTCRKGALLIEISKGLHQEVYKMQDLLLDVYHYARSEITILVDDGIEGHVQPTRDNIVAAIVKLVKDVKQGDQLFFYCARISLIGRRTTNTPKIDAGHATQIEDWSNSKEDGMNGCENFMTSLSGLCPMALILSLFWTPAIRDRRSISNIIAAIASPSHGSGRGRENSEEIRNGIGTGSAPAKSGLVRIGSSSNLKSGQMYTNIIPTIRGSLGRLRTWTLSLPGAEKDIDHDVDKPTWILTEEEVHCESPVGLFSCDGRCRNEGRSTVMEEGEDDEVKADVISLASCKYSQYAWEADGVSMTSSLVDLRRRNPHQSLKDLLTNISHATYSLALLRHDGSKKYKKQCKDYASQLRQKINELEHRNQSTQSLALPNTPPDTPPTIVRRKTISHETVPGVTKEGKRRVGEIARLKQILKDVLNEKGYDMDCFQNPELASPRPLDMNQPWRM
ncbi:hypothetical protein B0H14DRAFT_3765141 [Mycena olivaceomarginata]|nr:hypothetical protein B0H14DRAFT_3765141 [Mycena olivaceomarginata]